MNATMPKYLVRELGEDVPNLTVKWRGNGCWRLLGNGDVWIWSSKIGQSWSSEREETVNSYAVSFGSRIRTGRVFWNVLNLGPRSRTSMNILSSLATYRAWNPSIEDVSSHGPSRRHGALWTASTTGCVPCFRPWWRWSWRSGGAKWPWDAVRLEKMDGWGWPQYSKRIRIFESSMIFHVVLLALFHLFSMSNFREWCRRPWHWEGRWTTSPGVVLNSSSDISIRWLIMFPVKTTKNHVWFNRLGSASALAGIFLPSFWAAQLGLA